MKIYIIFACTIVILLFACKGREQKQSMEKVEFKDGSNIQFKPLTEAEYLHLSKQAVSGPLAHYKEAYGIDVSMLPNGQIIGKDRDYYGLYYSLSDLDKVLADFEANSSHGTEVLLNKNIYGRLFPQETDTLIRQLLSRLHMPYREPNRMLLESVDSNITALPNSGEFYMQHMINIIALLGEAIRGEYGASWKMELASDGVTWNPYLTIKGSKIQFFTYLYEDIFIKGETKNILMETYVTGRILFETI